MHFSKFFNEWTVVSDMATGVLTINLSAILQNWQLVKSFVGDAVECAAVVKANAYGMGVEKIALRLLNAGCKHFFVVTLQEAEQLRELLGQEVTIYLLSGLKANQFNKLDQLNIVPVLYDLQAIKQWIEFCNSQERALACVIKLDTGMTRLGLSLSDLENTFRVVERERYFNPVVVMSHMACADDPSHPLNQKQLQQFQIAVEKFRKFFPQTKFSLANSSATFLDKSYHFNMVRIGAALYGINPQQENKNPLHSVIQLKLPVLQNKFLEKRASIGYGATVEVPPGSRIVVTAGGYADGISRILVKDAQGMVGQNLVKLIGRISMDSCVFDISACENQSPTYVEIINDFLTLDKLIQRNQNLGYEILTSLGNRFSREYI